MREGLGKYYYQNNDTEEGMLEKNDFVGKRIYYNA